MRQLTRNQLAPNGDLPYVAEHRYIHNEGMLDIRQYGEGLGPNVDCTTAIQACINTGLHAFIPPGMTCRVNGMLTLDLGQYLGLGAGAALVRYADASSTDPVVWMRGSRATLVGVNESSKIYTQKPCPNGIVRLGYETAGGQNPPVGIVSARMSGLLLEGSRSMGQPSGAPDVGLKLINTQDLDGTPGNPGNPPSYFHRVRHLWVNNVNYAVEFLAWANGNFVSNIGGFGIGNGLIYLHGGLDNVIEGTFLTNSPDTPVIVIQDYVHHYGDGRPDALFQSCYNVCSAIGGEPSGENAATLKELAPSTGYGNCFQVQTCTNQGFTLLPDFWDRHNSVMSGDGFFGYSALVRHLEISGSTGAAGTAIISRNLDVGDTVTSSYVVANGSVTSPNIVSPSFQTLRADATAGQLFDFTHHWKCTGLAENTTYEVCSIPLGDANISEAVAEVKGTIHGGQGLHNSAFYLKFCLAKFALGSAPTVGDISKSGRILDPVIVGNTISIRVTVPNNGTGQIASGYLMLEWTGVNNPVITYCAAGVPV